MFHIGWHGIGGSNPPATLNNLDHHHYDGHYQQYMKDAAQGVAGQ
jgi:hypothetical protein